MEARFEKKQKKEKAFFLDKHGGHNGSGKAKAEAEA